MSYLGNPTLPRSCHSQGRDVEAGSRNHCSPLKKRGHCFLGQAFVMGPHGSCCPWLGTYSPEAFPSPGTFLLQGPALEGKSRESMSERGEDNLLQAVEWRRSEAGQTRTGS